MGIMHWNPELSWSSIINIILLVGALIGLFMRRSGDLGDVRRMVESNRILAESNTAAISTLSDAQASTANAILALTADQAELKGMMKIMIKNQQNDL